MALNILSDLKSITISCDSYILLKDAGKTYNIIRNAFEKMTFPIDKWVIDEHVMDIVCHYLSEYTKLKIDLESDKDIRFFGIPVEIIKR